MWYKQEIKITAIESRQSSYETRSKRQINLCNITKI
jgi:hypothetical protein